MAPSELCSVGMEAGASASWPRHATARLSREQRTDDGGNPFELRLEDVAAGVG